MEAPENIARCTIGANIAGACKLLADKAIKFSALLPVPDLRANGEIADAQ
jgi:hypothetical protein